MLTSSVSPAKRISRTILVVEDEPGIPDLIQRVLQHANYNVITSRNGDHAWGVIDRDQPKLDLVLTDIVMPGSMDGLTLASKIRQKYNNLPVLFMTGALPESDEHAAEMARKKLLLRKPFSLRQLIEFIEPHVGES
jgi:DNA-binding response OmpR family regulator